MLTFILPLLVTGASALAPVPGAHGAVGCRINTLLPAPDYADVSWSGPCKDGFADGQGIVAWDDDKDGERRIEGTLVRGSVTGEATLTWASEKRKGDNGRNSYIGTLRDGQPDGQGFFQYADGGLYEGGVASGKQHGAGIYINLDRSRYEGQWVDGERQGYGKATFALGGSYAGEWKHDRFDGPGTVVFVGPPRAWQGQFHNGRPEGTPDPGDATVGTFTTWSKERGTSSKLPTVIGSSFVPPLAGWPELTTGQQNLFKSFYPALAPGDEPPYPLHGMRDMNQVIARIHGELNSYHGAVRVLVLVGSDGKAGSVAVLGKVPPDVARYVSAAIMSQPYKSAVCQGVPCEMRYPINFYLD